MALPVRLFRPAGHYETMSQTPRSLILDLYGDYLRYVGTDVRLSPMTALLEEFDIAPATVRVTMSRLRREGWFTTLRLGRETAYTLSDEMLEVLDDGRQRIFATPVADWDGAWTMVIYQLSVPERHDRARLRKALAWHGFGSLATSTWLAPGDRRRAAASLTKDFSAEKVHILRCTSDGLEGDRDLAGRCWDLDALAASYREFIEVYRPRMTDLALLPGVDALRTRTELIATFRHFPFLDPWLPIELQPADWPGAEAHGIFRSIHAALAPAAEEFVQQIMGVEMRVPDPGPRVLPIAKAESAAT